MSARFRIPRISRRASWRCAMHCRNPDARCIFTPTPKRPRRTGRRRMPKRGMPCCRTDAETDADTGHPRWPKKRSTIRRSELRSATSPTPGDSADRICRGDPPDRDGLTSATELDEIRRIAEAAITPCRRRRFAGRRSTFAEPAFDAACRERRLPGRHARRVPSRQRADAKFGRRRTVDHGFADDEIPAVATAGDANRVGRRSSADRRDPSRRTGRRRPHRVPASCPTTR